MGPWAGRVAGGGVSLLGPRQTCMIYLCIDIRAVSRRPITGCGSSALSDCDNKLHLTCVALQYVLGQRGIDRPRSHIGREQSRVESAPQRDDLPPPSKVIEKKKGGWVGLMIPASREELSPKGYVSEPLRQAPMRCPAHITYGSHISHDSTHQFRRTFQMAPSTDEGRR